MTSTADPTPTRAGVTIVTGIHVGRDDLVTLPAKGGKLRSDRRWRLAYDADPIIIWTCNAVGLARIRVAGPASAAAFIHGLFFNARMRGDTAPQSISVAWEADDVIERHGHMSPEDVAHREAMTAATKEN